jgi:hypothetical protein
MQNKKGKSLAFIHMRHGIVHFVGLNVPRLLYIDWTLIVFNTMIYIV